MSTTTYYVLTKEFNGVTHALCEEQAPSIHGHSSYSLQPVTSKNFPIVIKHLVQSKIVNYGDYINKLVDNRHRYFKGAPAESFRDLKISTLEISMEIKPL